jgi:hypothetical protein
LGDVDDDMQDPDMLKEAFWAEAQRLGINRADFDRIVFVFALDRIENWRSLVKHMAG